MQRGLEDMMVAMWQLCLGLEAFAQSVGVHAHHSLINNGSIKVYW